MDVQLGQLLALLPLEARLKRYREMSLDALYQASITPDLRAGYLSMASGRHVLAGEIERAMDRFDTLHKTHDTPSAAAKRE